jgi:hypothetical protein
MVRKLGELPKFLVFNSRTESFGNSSVFTFSSLLFTLVQNYSLAFCVHNGKWMLPFVNANITLLHCVYLIQSFHHILLDMCKYLMMQSSIWQMVRTRTSEDSILDIPEGSVRHGCGQVPRDSAPPPPPRPPVSLEQLLVTQNNLMRRLV